MLVNINIIRDIKPAWIALIGGAIFLGFLYFNSSSFSTKKESPIVPDYIILNPQQSYINIDNKKFGPYSFRYDKETNVGIATFPGEDNGSGAPDEEILINFYLNNVWAPHDISVNDVVQTLDASTKQSGLTIEYGSHAPDATTQKNSYTIYATNPDASNNVYDVYFMVFKSTDYGVYQIQFAKTLNGSDEETHKKILQWVSDNINFLKQVESITLTNSWWGSSLFPHNKEYGFECPSNFESYDQYFDSLKRWTKQYLKDNPNANIEEIEKARDGLIEKYDCGSAPLEEGVTKADPDIERLVKVTKSVESDHL
ncbi:MAG: hypothetical protein ABIP54_02705 [Candidatus Andersenbacteria bacterium]